MSRKKDTYETKKAAQEKLENALDQYFDRAELHVHVSTDFDEEKVLTQIRDQIGRAERKNHRQVQWLSIAASILILVGTGIWWTATQWVTTSDFETVSIDETPILPGSNTATLTLADGSKISLDQMQVGVITTADGIQVTKDKEGRISYQHTMGSHQKTPAKHSIEIPKGGQYALVLPDGTKVWMNSDSKIKYPIEFNGASRDIELEGEAYFEVTHNPKQPFIVTTPRQQVRVLGTSFNVYAYAQETEQTTLLEGAVKVKSGLHESLLNPGQQANISAIEQMTIAQVDASVFTAWKDGDFSFQNTHIKDIMVQISRWYNIDVIYGEESSNVRLSGMVSRTKPLNTVLEVLEMTDKVKFELEENPKTKERRLRINSI